MRFPIQISAPSRLHFGLFSVGQQTQRQFGGVGLMIQSPRTRVQIKPAGELGISSIESETIQNHVSRWFDQYGSLLPQYQSTAELPCEIELVEMPPRHAGFGSGTQFALSVAVALFRFFELTVPKPNELAPLMGRGGRSAIGSHGFFQGGLLVDRGRTPDQSVAPLDFQIEFPPDWPIVLATLKNHQGLSGSNETAAFSELPNASEKQANSMIELVNQKLLPALIAHDYATFGEAVYNLSYQSGLLFQSVQGGPYNGRDIERLVELIRTLGISAVGQSSWGPCVFAIAPDNSTAGELQQSIVEQYGNQCEARIVYADNVGAFTNTVRE